MPIIADIIQSRREEIIRKLRDRDPDLMVELDILDSAIRGTVKSEPSGPYSSFNRAIDAIVTYLEAVGPSSSESIVAGLIAGGFGKGAKRTRANVKDSIRYHSVNEPVRLEEFESESGERLVRIPRV